MGDINRVALFGKLNSLAYKSIESATVFCKLRGNPYVELVHWFHQILQQPGSDVSCVVRAFNIDPSRLAQNFTEALDKLCLLYTSPSPRDGLLSRMPSSA